MSFVIDVESQGNSDWLQRSRVGSDKLDDLMDGSHLASADPVAIHADRVFKFFKSSDCGAGKNGKPGFQPGNTCAKGDGSGAGSTGEEKIKMQAPLEGDYDQQIQKISSSAFTAFNDMRSHEPGSQARKDIRDGFLAYFDKLDDFPEGSRESNLASAMKTAVEHLVNAPKESIENWNGIYTKESTKSMARNVMYMNANIGGYNEYEDPDLKGGVAVETMLSAKILGGLAQTALYVPIDEHMKIDQLTNLIKGNGDGEDLSIGEQSLLEYYQNHHKPLYDSTFKAVSNWFKGNHDADGDPENFPEEDESKPPVKANPVDTIAPYDDGTGWKSDQHYYEQLDALADEYDRLLSSPDKDSEESTKKFQEISEKARAITSEAYDNGHLLIIDDEAIRKGQEGSESWLSSVEEAAQSADEVIDEDEIRDLVEERLREEARNNTRIFDGDSYGNFPTEVDGTIDRIRDLAGVGYDVTHTINALIDDTNNLSSDDQGENWLKGLAKIVNGEVPLDDVIEPASYYEEMIKHYEDGLEDRKVIRSGSYGGMEVFQKSDTEASLKRGAEAIAVTIRKTLKAASDVQARSLVEIAANDAASWFASGKMKDVFEMALSSVDAESSISDAVKSDIRKWAEQYWSSSIAFESDPVYSNRMSRESHKMREALEARSAVEKMIGDDSIKHELARLENIATYHPDESQDFSDFDSENRDRIERQIREEKAPSESVSIGSDGSITCSDEARGAMKQKVVDDVLSHLSKSGVPEEDFRTFAENLGIDPKHSQATAAGEVVQEVLDRWASSSTKGKLMHMLHETVRAKFAKLYPNEKVVHSDGESDEWVNSQGNQAREALKDPLNARVMSAVVDAIYKNTQKQLTESHYLIKRGMGWQDKHLPGSLQEVYSGGASETRYRNKGEYVAANVTVEQNPLSSWTTHYDTARSFAESGHYRTVLVSSIPKERIFATAITGAGCLNEAEFLVIGGRFPAKLIITEGNFHLGESSYRTALKEVPEMFEGNVKNAG